MKNAVRTTSPCVIPVGQVPAEDRYLELGGVRVQVPRLWQKRGFSALDGALLALLNAPTGSGKSTLIRMLARAQLEHGRLTRVVIAVPQLLIASPFASKIPLLVDDRVQDWDVGRPLTTGKGSVDKLVTFLCAGPEHTPEGRTLVCSQPDAGRGSQAFDGLRRARRQPLEQLVAAHRRCPPISS